MSARPHADSRWQPALASLTNHLRRKSRKITGPRRAILEILGDHHHPMTNREVLAAMPKRCDLATVYRVMRVLEWAGIVRRFDFGDGTARFELVREQGGGHHHHLVCTGCAEVVEIEECFPSQLERRIAAKNKFKAVTHKLEFFGLCPNCQ